MTWIWTDDVARILLRADGLSEPGHLDHPLGIWLHRPIAVHTLSWNTCHGSGTARSRPPDDRDEGARESRRLNPVERGR